MTTFLGSYQHWPFFLFFYVSVVHENFIKKGKEGCKSDDVIQQSLPDPSAPPATYPWDVLFGSAVVRGFLPHF